MRTSMRVAFFTPRPAQLFQDTFSDANGTSLDAHVPDIRPAGVLWEEVAGDWDLQDNQANAVSGATQIAVVQSGLADLEVETTFSVTATGIVFRLVDANNYWYARYRTDLNGIQVFRVLAGGTAQAGGLVISGPTLPASMRVRLAGESIQVTVNGQTLVTGSTTHQSATKHGLWGGGGLGRRFDDFMLRRV